MLMIVNRKHKSLGCRACWLYDGVAHAGTVANAVVAANLDAVALRRPPAEVLVLCHGAGHAAERLSFAAEVGDRVGASLGPWRTGSGGLCSARGAFRPAPGGGEPGRGRCERPPEGGTPQALQARPRPVPTAGAVTAWADRGDGSSSGYGGLGRPPSAAAGLLGAGGHERALPGERVDEALVAEQPDRPAHVLRAEAVLSLQALLGGQRAVRLDPPAQDLSARSGSARAARPRACGAGPRRPGRSSRPRSDAFPARLRLTRPRPTAGAPPAARPPAPSPGSPPRVTTAPRARAPPPMAGFARHGRGRKVPAG
jgi:hypothetical protein